jgi:hypothetical protein
MGVVVIDVDAEDTLELRAAADQEPVEAVAADGADPAFGERVCLWCAERGDLLPAGVDRLGRGFL